MPTYSYGKELNGTNNELFFITEKNQASQSEAKRPGTVLE